VWEADVLHYAAYAIGDYRDGRFTAEQWGRLTFGPSYYAPSYFRDAAGHPCVTFWMRGVQDAADGWTGAHSVPYRLTLQGNALVATPHPDITPYRQPMESSGEVGGLASDAVWSPGRRLRIVSGGQEAAALRVDGSGLVLTVDGQSWSMPYDDGPVRVIVDGPTLEVSTAGGLIGSAIAPAGDSLRFEVDAASTLEVWALRR
jgi:beta-fructofuranosidase